MHERGMVSAAAANLIETVSGRSLSEVTVAIGPTVSAEIAAEAWMSAVLGTTAEQATVHWVGRSHVLACFLCGWEYAGDKLDVCPQCGGNGLVVAAAPEVEVEDWRFEGES